MVCFHSCNYFPLLLTYVIFAKIRKFSGDPFQAQRRTIKQMHKDVVCPAGDDLRPATLRVAASHLPRRARRVGRSRLRPSLTQARNRHLAAPSAHVSFISSSHHRRREPDYVCCLLSSAAAPSLHRPLSRGAGTSQQRSWQYGGRINCMQNYSMQPIKTIIAC